MRGGWTAIFTPSNVSRCELHRRMWGFVWPFFSFFALQQIFKVFVRFAFLQVLSLRASSSAKVWGLDNCHELVLAKCRPKENIWVDRSSATATSTFSKEKNIRGKCVYYYFKIIIMRNVIVHLKCVCLCVLCVCVRASPKIIFCPQFCLLLFLQCMFKNTYILSTVAWVAIFLFCFCCCLKNLNATN